MRMLRLLSLAVLMCAGAFGQDVRDKASAARERAVTTRETSAYDSGTRALDNNRYEDAVRDFERAVAAHGTRTDGALYWKAYALNRLGRHDDALAAITALRHDFPSSRWVNDAQALEVEAGKPAATGDDSNEELKLLAINGLMNADPARAVPLLEGVLKGSGSPRLKDKAMLVLTQSHSPQAQQVLANYAKGTGANPDLQRRAIRYLGMGGTMETRQLLVEIYNASSDPEVKREILQSLAMSGSSGAVLEIARSDKNAALRIDAVRALMMTKDQPGDALVKLYNAESDASVKREILNLLMIRRNAKDLVEIARKEPDPELKKRIVERLSTMRNDKDAMDYMMELLK
jgi:tetratricopeptide (TPR) repeat protein